VIKKIIYPIILLIICSIIINHSLAIRKKKSYPKKSLRKKISLKSIRNKVFKIIEEGDINKLAKILQCCKKKINSITGPDGCTALHKAASLGKKKMVELLVFHKASILIEDKNGFTPIQSAEDAGNLEIANFLKKEAKEQKIEFIKKLKEVKKLEKKKKRQKKIQDFFYRISSFIDNICATKENFSY